MRVRALENVIYAGKIYPKGEEIEISESSKLAKDGRKVEVVKEQPEAKRKK